MYQSKLIFSLYFIYMYKFKANAFDRNTNPTIYRFFRNSNSVSNLN